MVDVLHYVCFNFMMIYSKIVAVDMLKYCQLRVCVKVFLGRGRTMVLDIQHRSHVPQRHYYLGECIVAHVPTSTPRISRFGCQHDD